LVRGVPAEGILLGKRLIADEAQMKLIQNVGSEDVRPANGSAVRVNLLAAECRGRGAVGDAPEVAGNEAGAVDIAVANKKVVGL